MATARLAIGIVLHTLAVAAMARPPEHVFAVDSEYGPGTLTRDLFGQLDWLDLTFTAHRSYNDVYAQTQPGGQFATFRYASRDDVIGLWRSAGIPFIDGTGNYPENLPGVTFLISLVGSTFQQSPEAYDADAMVSNRVTYNGLQWRQALGLFRYQNSAGAFTNGINLDNEVNSRGSWLVRAIPEPNLAMPILALALRRRRSAR